MQLAPDAAALSTDESSLGAESTTDSNQMYCIQSDFSLKVLSAGQAKPGDAAVTFSSMEELTAVTRDWRMPQYVTLWNKVPNARVVKRFDNRRIAIQRVSHAIERLQKEATERGQAGAEKKGRAGSNGSKSDRILALLRAPEGATLTALMEATGWQAHSVRGFLSGTVSKRLGLPVESFRRNGERVYGLRAVPLCEQSESPVTAGSEAFKREGE